MRQVVLSGIPEEVAEAVSSVAEGREHVLVEYNGAKVALVSVRDLELLERVIEMAEDRIDNEAADRALAEAGDDVPWEAVKKKAGLA